MKKLLLLITLFLPVALVAQINAVKVPKWRPPNDTNNRRLEVISVDLINHTRQTTLLSEDYVADIEQLAFNKIVSFPYDPSIGANENPGSDKIFQPLRPAYVEPGFPQFPYSTVVRIEMYSSFGSLGFCSGILIGPDLVITAGHCGHNPPAIDDNITAIKVIPAYDNGNAPYGQISAASYAVFDQYKENENLDYDIMLIKLVTPIGLNIGYMGWQSSVDYDKFMNDANVFYMMGFPASTITGEPVYDMGQRMWYTNGYFDFEGDGVFTPGNINCIYNRNKSFKGLSGAGSYLEEDGNEFVMAVYSHGVESTDGNIAFTGHVRIDPLIGTYIQQLIAGGTGVIENANEIAVFPSPATDFIEIKLHSETEGEVSILDMSGRECYRAAWTGENINVSALAAGIYSLELKTANGSLVTRFAKAAN